MRARDQSSIFSTGGKFCPDYGLLLELYALTLVARSYALLVLQIGCVKTHILLQATSQPQSQASPVLASVCMA